jgi:hypothetical protein
MHTHTQGEPERFDTDKYAAMSLSEPSRFALQQDRVEEVRRLKMMNFNQKQIIHKIWGVHKGDSQTYRDAREEYQQILSQL